MKDKIISIIKKNGIKEWMLRITEKKGTQEFYIGEEREMVRFLDAVELQITVYKSYTKGKKRYRGSMTVDISPSMYEKEISEKLQLALHGAGTVKNPWYPLSDSESLNRKTNQNESVFDSLERNMWTEVLAGDILSRKDRRVVYNALELSVIKNTVTLANSDGVEYSWSDYSCFTELVTTAEGKEGEVEICGLYNFSDYLKDQFIDRISLQTVHTLDRAEAVRLSDLENLDVLISGQALYEFFSFFMHRAGSKMIYDGLSGFNSGTAVQKDGDLLTIDIIPYLEGSSRNSLVDLQGIVPVPVRIIEDGVEKSVISDLQFGTYINKGITGKSSNIAVMPGSIDRKSLKGSSYLEAVEFSDFNMDPVTGDFGGEIRLAYYSDGNNVIPVTGGSVTGNINRIIDSIMLSSEIKVDGSYKGPDFVLMKGLNISG